MGVESKQAFKEVLRRNDNRQLKLAEFLNFSFIYVSPLINKSGPLNVINYRPISDTNTFSKNFKKLKRKQISDYLLKHNIMRNEHFTTSHE